MAAPAKLNLYLHVTGKRVDGYHLLDGLVAFTDIYDVLTLALFNACLGWTGFGWLLALYWSLQPNPPKNVAGEVVETRKIVRMRAFSSALLVRVQRRAATREHPENKQP